MPGKSSTKRDLNTELRAAIADMGKTRWVRKTVLTRRADGSMRRRIVLPDGTVEKDAIVPASAPARASRAGAGKSAKTAFEIAREIGVVGIDGDRRRNVAEYHSKYLKAGGKYRKMR